MIGEKKKIQEKVKLHGKISKKTCTYSNIYIFSLFCDKISKTPEDSLKHCKETHSFDLMKIKSEWNLDLYSTIKLVNYTRQQVCFIN